VKVASLALAAGVLVVNPARGDDAQPLLQKYNCNYCHHRDASIVGPAYVDIAAKYRGNRNAVKVLTGVVRKGDSGGWPWHMPPNPAVSDADVKKMIRYILSLH